MYYNNVNLINPSTVSDTINTAYGLACTNFFFTITSILFSVFSMIACLFGIKGFTPKGKNIPEEIREVY